MTKEKKLTGYPSIDRPWLKYYAEEAINMPLPECTMYDYLFECNKNNLDDTALNYYDTKISYGELFERIEKAAAAFCAIGVRKGDSVLILSVTLPEVIYSVYALNRIGAIANMVDPRTSPEGIRHYAQESGSRFLVALDAVGPKINDAIFDTEIEKVIIISPSDSLAVIKKLAYRVREKKTKFKDKKYLYWRSFIRVNAFQAIPKKEYKRDECCIIVHTGGTTGTPKCVMLSDHNLNSTVLQVRLSGFNTHRRDRWLGIMPPFIAYGIGNGMHFPLCRGMELIIIPSFDPKRYDALLLKYKPLHMAGVPSHYDNLIRSKKLRNRDLTFLVSPVVGGDGMDVACERQVNEFFARHNCSQKLIKGYGMTEICAAVCASARMEYNKLGSVGIPFTHSVVSVFDPSTEEELTYGEEGEVCMQAPHIMLGYSDDLRETQKILRTHKDGSIWLHSGDLGYMDEDGCLFIKGRMKRMIIRHDGFKVFPSSIESVVLTHPSVKRCCAVGIKDKAQRQGELPVVFVVPESGSGPDQLESELAELCRKELPEYAQPVKWRFMEELPLTPIGKIDYKALQCS